MKVIYTGSFNPFHNGHECIYNEACEIFGKNNVYLGIACNKSKFKDINEFNDFAKFNKWVLKPITNNVVIVDGLVADYCKQHNFDRIIRGIKQGNSLEQEEKLAYWNCEISDVSTIYIPSNVDTNQISSSVLREFKSYGKSYEFLSKYAPKDSLGRWFYNDDIPEVNIYYGKSCVGKTTYLKNQNKKAIPIDQMIWDYCKVDSKKDFEKEMREYFEEAMKSNVQEEYESMIEHMGRMVDWKGLLIRGASIDFPVFGNYYDVIPPEVKYKFNYLECLNSYKGRVENCNARGWEESRMQHFDVWYETPPFYDNQIWTGREEE